MRKVKTTLQATLHGPLHSGLMCEIEVDMDLTRRYGVGPGRDRGSFCDMLHAMCTNSPEFRYAHLTPCSQVVVLVFNVRRDRVTTKRRSFPLTTFPSAAEFIVKTH